MVQRLKNPSVLMKLMSQCVFGHVDLLNENKYRLLIDTAVGAPSVTYERANPHVPLVLKANECIPTTQI